MILKTNWGKTEALDATNLNRIEGNIQELLQTKADGVTYTNLQLQLTSQGVPVGAPVIVGGQQTFLNAFFSGLSVGSYTAATNVTSFPISELTSAKTAFLIHNNQFLVPGQEFTLDYAANRAMLTYTLNKGETVHYMLFGVSFSYNDLLGKPTVVNNLTTPDLTENTVLDARQGRILKQAIEDSANTVLAQMSQTDNRLEELISSAKQEIVNSVPAGAKRGQLYFTRKE